jgi:hypothetical protein
MRQHRPANVLRFGEILAALARLRRRVKGWFWIVPRAAFAVRELALGYSLSPRWGFGMVGAVFSRRDSGWGT